jgi:thiaminase
MKNSILILGIALVSLTTVCSAANTTNNPFHLFKETILADNNEAEQSQKTARLAKPSLNEEAEVFNPETVIAYTAKTVKETIAEGDEIIENTTSYDAEFMAYEESMKEIIAQSDLIIENTVSNETFPLYGERTMEDEIAELEIIIESTETNEVSPLDFKKINNNSMMTNTFNSKRFVGMN